MIWSHFWLIFKLWAFLNENKLPNFAEKFSTTSLSDTQNLDASTTVICEILNFQFRSFLIVLQTLSISEWKVFKVPNSAEELLRAILGVTQTLDALATALLMILNFELKSFLVVFQTLSICEWKVVWTPNFEE